MVFTMILRSANFLRYKISYSQVGSKWLSRGLVVDLKLTWFQIAKLLMLVIAEERKGLW